MRSSVKETSKKPEDNSKQLENTRKLGSNKQCFDCGEKGTTYVVMSFGTFVCSRCAGLLRDLTYKVKGIGVCNFSDQELAFLNKMGNDNAKLIWLAKFDAKKEKLPDPKDSEAVRKHITLKYKEKRFSVKDPEKAMKDGDIKKQASANSKTKKEESDDEDDEDEESESEDEKTKKKSKNSKTKAHEEAKPYTTQKLAPLHMKNSSLNQPNQANSSNLNKNSNFTTTAPIIKKSSNTDESGWANFPNSNSNSNTNSNNMGGFTFFDSAPVNNHQSTKNHIENVFTFSDNNPSSNTQNNQPINSNIINANSNNKANEWGIVWDNNTSPVQALTSNTSINLSNITTNPFDNTGGNVNQSNKLDTGFDFNFVNTNSFPLNDNTNILQGNKQNNQSNNNTFGNLNLSNMNIGNSSNSNSMTLNNQPGNSSQILSQNLNNVYNNSNTQENPKKKNLDDLDKILGDTSLIAPVNVLNVNNGMPNSNQHGIGQPMQMGGQQGGHMMGVQPQMLQQMQMMMMNPQMQNNPQMMQMMQMMMQNMMIGVVNPVNPMGGNQMPGMIQNNPNSYQMQNQGIKNELSDLNFGGMNIGSQQQNQGNNNNSITPPPKQDDNAKFDVFKDIYNYSKGSGGRPSNPNNQINFNLSNNQPPSTSSQSTNISPPQNNLSNSSYNPFDFY